LIMTLIAHVSRGCNETAMCKFAARETGHIYVMQPR
jgi:hypothetical protein